MRKRLKVCFFTGSRGEYGALRWLMKDMREDPAFEVRVVALGSHLLREYGYTYRELERDGHKIDAKLPGSFDTRSALSLAKAVGLWTGGAAEALARFQPDLAIVAGDRYELLAVVPACVLLLTPIAHISGGEVTEGAIDEQTRHAVTKMAHFHFVSNEDFARRVRRMGEEPWRVKVTGDPGLDTLRRLRPLSRRELEDRLKLDLLRPTALCTFHSVTLEAGDAERQSREFVSALERVPLQYVVTYPNADQGSRGIIARLERFARARPDSVRLVPSLGQHAYLSLMRHVRMMVGNSSSGLWEAPSLNLPVVNIGNRQEGRMRAANVIDVACRADAVAAAMRRALRYDRSRPCRNPYGDGRASARIRAYVKNVFARKDRETILKKRFADR
ncbi:MAG TPA: UDP-N-acetylglucosamine 2-epimerase [Elusimicrobiota bacterium]|nr:UDP-N-acetylglucosamine 2-epimerase [Elusimicrobiota bacterium]